MADLSVMVSGVSFDRPYYHYETRHPKVRGFLMEVVGVEVNLHCDLQGSRGTG
jgi:hypothetical protein